jgi:hypothetical protein
MKKGTCQVCFAAHPLNKNGYMRKHIRERGYSERDCPGSAFKPFEIDCTGLQWVLDSYIKELALTREKLLSVHLSPEVYERGTWVDPQDGFGVIQDVIKIIKPGDPDYERLVEQKRRALNNNVMSYRKALAEMDAVLKRYEPTAGFLEDAYEAPYYHFAPIHHNFFIPAPNQPA